MVVTSLGMHLTALWLLIVAFNLIETCSFNRRDENGLPQPPWKNTSWYVPTGAGVLVWSFFEVVGWVTYFLIHL